MNTGFSRGFALKKVITRCVFGMTRLLCFGIAKVVFRLHVEGQEFVPRFGPAILASNHVSYIDPVIIWIAIRRPVRFMAKQELFRFRPFGWLIRRFGAFPVNRGRMNVQAFKLVTSLLQSGEIIGMFPEGTRGDGVSFRPAKPGIGLIAARTGVPVIPVFHRGTAKVLPRGAWFPRPYRVTVQVGAPCGFVADPATNEEAQVMMFSQMIMDKIAALRAWSESGSGVGVDRRDAFRKRRGYADEEARNQ